VIHPKEISKSISEITKECKEMIHITLHKRNMPWFVDFFTELLLQIGLVPIQETDDDILRNVSDKARLQKLHSRFTSKVEGSSGAAHRNKSSQRLSLDNAPSDLGRKNNINGAGGGNSNGDVSNDIPTRRPSPDHYFIGHQEFFFRFIRFVDSYTFSVHLRNRLVTLITNMWSLNNTKGLEERIKKMQMISKFLGVLAFSPSWTDDDMLIDPSLPMNGVNSLDMTTANTSVIEANHFIIKGWKERKMIVTLPWVLSFLQMMCWDTSSIHLPDNRETLSLLRSMHKWIILQALNGHGSRESNFLFLSLQLESFFSDVIGLGEVECLPISSLPSMYSGGNGSEGYLDDCNTAFSRSFVLSLSSHLDELQKLIADLSSGNVMTVGGTSKKLKPYALSSHPISVDLSLMDEHQSNINLKNPSTSGVVGKLVDSFFHQHKEIQPICEFVIDLSLKYASKDTVHESVASKVNESFYKHYSKEGDTVKNLVEPLNIDWYLTMLRNVELDTFHPIHLVLSNMIRRYILNAMNTLLPPFANEQVKCVASALCIKHACQRAKTVITSLIRTEVKKNIDNLVRRGPMSGLSNIKKPPLNAELFQVHVDLKRKLFLINRSIEDFLNSDVKPFHMPEEQCRQLIEITGNLQEVFDRKQIMSNLLMASDFEEVFRQLITNIHSVLHYWLPLNKFEAKGPFTAGDSETPPFGFIEIIDLLCQIRMSNVCRQDTFQIVGQHLCEEKVLYNILSWDDFNDMKRNDLVALITKIVKSQVISKHALEISLTKQLTLPVMTQRATKQCMVILGTLRQL